MRLGALFLAFSATIFAATALDRELVLTPLAGNMAEDREIARGQQRAAAPEATAASFEALGWAFVAKARRTQDAGFFKLAEKTVEVCEAQFGVTDETRLLHGHVLHNLHRFHEAETLARTLVAHRDGPRELALLSDALVEQGKLTGAIEVLQRLVTVKPGAEAYSRIAHVRWLKGDLEGASVAMEQALGAVGTPAGETVAWMLTRLSAYALQSGDVRRARALADAAGRGTEDYAPALLARGRALLAGGNVTDAVAALQRAASLAPLPEYQWWLLDALEVAGEDAAATVWRGVRARGAAEDPRTFALLLATRGEDTAHAVQLVRAELKNRQDPLTWDALAWAFAAAGELDEAAAAMARALAEGTCDARLWLHAGEIARRRGEPDAAALDFGRAQGAAATLTPSERALLQRASTALSLIHPTKS